MLVRIQKRSN